MIDFAKIDGAIQPIRIEPGTNIITLLDNWTTFRQPSEHLELPQKCGAKEPLL